MRSHTLREKQKLLNRIRRICGQAEGIERMREGEKSCAEVIHAIAGVKGALNDLMGEVIEDHVRLPVTAELSQAERDEGAAELIDVLTIYRKQASAP